MQYRHSVPWLLLLEVADWYSIIFDLLPSFERRIHPLSFYQINGDPPRSLASAMRQPFWPFCVITDDSFAGSTRPNFVTMFFQR